MQRYFKMGDLLYWMEVFCNWWHKESWDRKMVIVFLSPAWSSLMLVTVIMLWTSRNYVLKALSDAYCGNHLSSVLNCGGSSAISNQRFQISDFRTEGSQPIFNQLGGTAMLRIIFLGKIKVDITCKYLRHIWAKDYVQKDLLIITAK